VSAPDPGSIIATINGTFATPGGEHGTYTQNVLRTLGGTLDFDTLVTANVTNPSDLEALSFFNFAGFTTDVGYNPLLSTAIPGTITRSTLGDVIGVDYHLPFGSEIRPGQQVDIIIKTDAHQYTSGILGVIDGGTANANIYAPVVPEP